MRIIILSLFFFGLMFARENISSGQTAWDDGILMFKSDDEQFELRFDTRVFMNATYFLNDDKEILSNQTHLQKARFAMKTKVWKNWRMEFDFDVAGELVSVKDMFINFIGFNNSSIKLGNYKMPLGLNELTSSRFLTFVERAYAMNAFETDRKFGLEYSRWGQFGIINYNVRGAVFGQGLEIAQEKDYEKEVDETGGGKALRIVIAGRLSENILIHAGFSTVSQTPDDDKNVTDFKSEPETKSGDIELLNTGNISDVDHSSKMGLEGAFQFRNFCVQGDFIQTSVIRMNDKMNASFSGGYAFFSWIITGETRPWIPAFGEFWQVIPNNNKVGAWEIAARFSHLNLTDEDAEIYGGKANNITLGLNWYANPNIKFQLNYTIVDNSKNANSKGKYIMEDTGYDFGHIQFMTIFWL